MTNENTGNMPEKKFSTGAISATVWRNQGKNKQGEINEFNTITLQRRYMDKKGEWQTTSSMRVNDLPRAKLVLDKAFEYLVLKQDTVTNTDTAAIAEEVVM